MTHVPDGAAVPSPDEERRAVGASGGGRGRTVTRGRAAAGGGADDGERRSARGVDGPSSRGAGRILTRRLRLAPVAEADEAELFALHSDPRAFVEDSTDPLTDPAQMRWVLAQWRRSWARHGLGHLTVRAREGADLPVGLLGVVGLVPLAGDGAPDAAAHDAGAGRERVPGAGSRDASVLSAYWRLSPEVTGRGVATEAMRAVLGALTAGAPRGVPASDDGTAPHISTAARDDTAAPDAPAPEVCTPPHEIVAITDRGNTASLALASRLGFRPAPPDRPVPGGRADDVLLLLDPPATA